ncbi:MAG: recombinase family protein [Lachnospiraceae bacterium]|nr:recombinase family protein [Lachnospiraceae bacterium]
MGRIFGYARVSSQEQNLDRQIIALKKYVPEDSILVDKASGKDTDRPSYQALKGALGLREGDTLYVMSLDRLSRNKSDIKKELEWFKERKIRLMILDLPTSLIEVPEGQEWILDMITNILVEVLSSMAEQERLTIKRRQREGIKAAKAKGKHLGRPRAVMPEHFPRIHDEWRQGKITTKQAIEILELKPTTFYRLVKRYESK